MKNAFSMPQLVLFYIFFFLQYLKTKSSWFRFILSLKIDFESTGDKTWLQNLKFENFDKIQYFLWVFNKIKHMFFKELQSYAGNIFFKVCFDLKYNLRYFSEFLSNFDANTLLFSGFFQRFQKCNFWAKIVV